MKRFLVCVSVLLASSPALSQQYPTIVGEWYAEETGSSDCGSQFSTQIGPMLFAEETYICRFDDVRRDGWQVTWNGQCSDGSSNQQTQVVALEEEGRLTVWFNGNPGWSTLRRCNGETGAVPPKVDRLHLQYTEHPGDTDVAQDYWGDFIETVSQMNPPPVVPVTVGVAEAADYTFAYITGGMACGTGLSCPVRIFQNGAQLGEFSACENLDDHWVSADGTRFFDCDGDDEHGRPLAWLMGY